MDTHHFKNISNYFVAGINYKKSDAAVRGRFAVSGEQYLNILKAAPAYGLNELFIISTCNRTEIYGFAHSSSQLINLLCTQTAGDAETFKASAYIKSGAKAIEHLFHVGAGLDSQILGDYEIVGQLKAAAKVAKSESFVGAFTERLLNCVLQASKIIKNTTTLSGGTVSVSFAAVQYIRAHVADIASKNILLIGTGKIGRTTCKNIVDYLGTKNITLVNRSADKAMAIAASSGLSCAAIENLVTEVEKADIILVATNSPKPTVMAEYLVGRQKLVIDLSVPCNVEAAAKDLPNVQLVNVDELSKLKDETLKKRKAEVPKAKGIIAGLMLEFTDWHDMRKHVPLLKDLKEKLKCICSHPQYTSPAATVNSPKMDIQIQRVLNETAGKIRVKNERGCQYIDALNQFMSAGKN